MKGGVPFKKRYVSVTASQFKTTESSKPIFFFFPLSIDPKTDGDIEGSAQKIRVGLSSNNRFDTFLGS